MLRGRGRGGTVGGGRSRGRIGACKRRQKSKPSYETGLVENIKYFSRRS